MPRGVLIACAAVVGALACSPATRAQAATLTQAATPTQAVPTPCKVAPALSCTTVSVPVDREGLAPGTIELQVGRRLSGPTQSTSAVVALAGGPGQAALPLGESLAEAIAPALDGRDLIVFDQRGTGESDPLDCAALGDSLTASLSAGEVLGRCAQELGPARAGFTSEESAQDIEAIREALGYQKLVLYGTSYGTRVALRYAEQYPQNVEALVLDSVVPPDGPEPFSITSFEAIPRVVDELCSANACKHITSTPVKDIATLAARLAKQPLGGSVYGGNGKRHSAELDDDELFDILEAGDLNPALRALLPAAVVSALHDNPDPILRLSALASGLTPNVPVEPTTEEDDQSEDNALFFATSCEERAFPWERTATSAVRLSQADAALSAIPAGDFYPFDAHVSLDQSLVPECLDWPDEGPAPPAETPLPNVPTLILSGAQDLRTPTAGARTVAAEIPDAQLLVVPYTGHSVIGSDLTSCASEAVSAFFAGAQVQPCKPSSNYFSPTPTVPTKLAQLPPAHGLHGRPGRTLTAILETVVDLERQIIGATLQAEADLPSGSSFGGLHGGYARLEPSTVRLSHLAFVPGVKLTGELKVSDSHLVADSIRIGGPAAARGTVRITASTISGTLGGSRFSMSLASATKSDAASARPDPFRASAGDPASVVRWPSSTLALALPALTRLR